MDRENGEDTEERCSGEVAIDLKVSSLQEEINSTNNRLEGFGTELKILLAQVNVISDWISEKFGVELMDKSSFLFKNISNYEEVEEIASNISARNRNGKSKPVSSEKKKNKRKTAQTVIKNEVFSDDSDYEVKPTRRKRGRPGRPKKSPRTSTKTAEGRQPPRKRGRPSRSKKVDISDVLNEVEEDPDNPEVPLPEQEPTPSSLDPLEA